MITFLVTLAAFHFYNFLINKDGISEKVLDDSALKDTNETLFNIGEVIAKFNTKIFDIQARYDCLQSISKSDLEKLSFDRGGSIILTNKTYITQFTDDYSKIKNNNITTDFTFGSKKKFFIKWIITILYILSLMSYFVSGSIKDGIFLYVLQIIHQKHFFHISEVLSYLCFFAFLWEIWLVFEHKNKYEDKIKEHKKKIKTLFDKIEKSQNDFDNFVNIDFKILENQLKISDENQSDAYEDMDDEIPF